MISDDLRRLVERTFPDAFGESSGDDAEFRAAILDAMVAGKSLTFLGQDRGCDAREMGALKKIEEAHRTGVVPDYV